MDKQTALEQMMDMPWQEKVTSLAEGGGVSLTVPPLQDFELFGDEREVRAQWREALRGHLRAYLEIGKAIPLPPAVYSQIALDQHLLSWSKAPDSWTT